MEEMINLKKAENTRLSNFPFLLSLFLSTLMLSPHFLILTTLSLENKTQFAKH